MIRKTGKLFLCALLCVSLTACSSAGNGAGGTTEQAVDQGTEQATQQTAAAESPAETLSPAAYSDGVYTGAGTGRNGEIVTEVTVEGGKIASVQVTSHEESRLISDRALSEIPENVVRYQTLSVDSITGATYSSMGVKAAIYDALVQAGGDDSTIYAEVEKDPIAEAEVCDADIAIVGAGLAGLSAAVKAIQLGQNVVIFEQSGQAGGSATVASGWVTGAGTQMQKDAGIEDSADQFYADIEMGAPIVYPELTRVYVDRSAEMVDWLESLGVEFEGRKPSYGLYQAVETPRVYHAAGGYKIVEPLLAYIEASGQASLLLDTEVTSLIVEDGTVKGLIAENANGEKEYEFKAVIMTTGGYDNDMELQSNYFTNVGSGAPSTADGKGTRMLLGLGATLSQVTPIAPYPGAIPEQGVQYIRYKAAVSTYTGGILVNTAGTRFVNEQTAVNGVPWVMTDQNIGWYIVSESGKDTSQNVIKITGYNEAELTPEESWELLESLAESENCVYKADTIEELADKIGVDASALADTAAGYDAGVESGEDALGRTNTTSLSGGPYYAIYTIPYVIQTANGILTDAEGRVLDADGNPFTGLYAAGELVGMNNFCAASYGGKSLGNASEFGMIAAESAVSFVQQ